MKIGMDVDGVLTNLERFYFDCGTKFIHEEGFKVNIVNDAGYRIQDIYGVNDDMNLKFWEKYLDDYMTDEKIRPYAAETVNKLLEEGNEIYIITARFLTDKNTEAGERNRQILKNWLEKNNLNYTKIIFSGEEKLLYCIENKIDIMIEDSPKNIAKLSKVIPMICFDAKYNKQCNGDNIIRCYSFYDIYSKINELKIKQRV